MYGGLLAVCRKHIDCAAACLGRGTPEREIFKLNEVFFSG